ncbi:hypothetical protein NEUTE1DRAFT_127946 [Neurospora tetrasperma FGSC 2508]|uniref:Uncharacterized protein n=1 Tax=Neurospora tetrasperma (strain FGSC 2508 / ATCC MYA-4615 / P0657) TaxID=510951 RepID=F8MCK0_NEUT8|nr:uncharacterized protein NEUTE1DRAFT_127946 [Neurospora tetrasperma FGSC 2508]EGO61301.1 hypothetical protein NEUTE1DRAFT_127946 [Neurospora tetrasperma FGSC 2508]EGZ74687.1 hypothetical protein NEUTE2DRAFT_103639 [Neurospora tetrasperma FGSC 2509]
MPGRHRAYTTEHPAKGFKWFPWKREKKVVVEPVQVWSDWVSSEDGTYFYRARKLADGTWGDYEYTEGYYMGNYAGEYAGGYAGGYADGYMGGIEIPQEKEYHPAVAVSPWKLPEEPVAIMPESSEVMEDPEPRYAEIAESEPIGEFSVADEEEQHQGTTTNATSVSGDDAFDSPSEDDGYRESEPLPTVQEAEPMVFTHEPEPFRALSPVPTLRREYKPRRRHTTGADTSVPASYHRPRVPHRHTFNEGQKEGHKDSHSQDHHHHRRTKSHDSNHKQPLLFSIFYAVTKTHAGPQIRRMPSASPHRSSTRGKSTTRTSTRPSTATSSSSSRAPSASVSKHQDNTSTRVAVPKTSTQKPTTKKPPVTTRSTKPKKPPVPTASETTVVVPLDTGVPSVIAPPGKATITKTKKFNSKIKSEKEMKVDSKKMIKGWLAGMEPGAEDKKMKGKGIGKERGRRMTK